MIRVRVVGPLKDYTGGEGEVEVAGAPDVLGMVRELDRTHPGIGRRILDDQDHIRVYVNVFVNSENARGDGGERARLKDGDTVHILPSVAGG